MKPHPNLTIFTPAVLMMLILPACLFADNGIDEVDYRYSIRTGMAYYGHAHIINIDLAGSHDHDYNEISYITNNSYMATFAASFDGFGLSINKTTPLYEDDPDVYGKTEGTDFQLYYFGRHFGADVFYQKYATFYIDEPHLFGLEKGQPGTIREDFHITAVGMNAYYSFSDDYSLSASFNQGEIQRDSGGSWIVTLSYIDYRSGADRTVIPESERPYFEEYATYKGMHGRFGFISLGYGYNLIFHGLFFSIAFSGGMGGGGNRVETETESFDQLSYGYKWNLKISTGINTEHFFASLYFFGDLSEMKSFKEESELTISSSLGTFGGYVGTRF